MGLLYNLGNILVPNQKLSLYRSETWEKHFKDDFQEQFKAYYMSHYSIPEDKLVCPSQPAKKASNMSLSEALAAVQLKNKLTIDTCDDATTYLSSPLELIDDLIAWWKSKQAMYLGLV